MSKILSYNGWEASPDWRAIGINPNFAPLGIKFPGGVKGGDVEVVFTDFATQFSARVEALDLPGAKDEWGYYFKKSANSPKLWSTHGSGTGLDLNATRHPNGKRGTFSAYALGKLRELLAEYDGVIHWLGDARGTPDEMHFEIKGTPGQVKRVADKIRARGNTAPPSTPGTIPITSGDEDMKMIEEYLFVQMLYNVYADRESKDIDHPGLSYWIGRCRAPENQIGAQVNADRVRDEFVAAVLGKAGLLK